MVAPSFSSSLNLDYSGDDMKREGKVKGLYLLDSSKFGGMYVANWRVLKPRIDQEGCISCQLCVGYCPEAAIKTREDGKPVIDYKYCKGCGICANECPRKAIEMVEEG